LGALENAEYLGVYEETIRLTSGKYEGEPFVEGGASRPTVIFIEPYAFGDLNGDGVADAVALLVENSGGSGSFIYLAAMVNDQGKAQNVSTLLLGDRAQIQSIAIEAGAIVLNMVSHGPDVAMCCPTQEVVQAYALRGDELVQISSQVITSGPAASPDITGIVNQAWQWEETAHRRHDCE